jgi:hypothetical protein
MDVLKCKVGDVVVVGDQYGKCPYVCVREVHKSEKMIGLNVVHLLNLLTGEVEENGYNPNYPSFADDCYRVDAGRLSETELTRLKDAWGVDAIAPFRKPFENARSGMGAKK